MLNIRRDSLPPLGFYAYVHCRPDGTPFYVGKGSGGRGTETYSRSKAYLNCVDKHGRENIHIRIYPQDSEQSAYAAEVRLIEEFKRIGFKLHNLADGGRGGTAGIKMSQESSDKKSRALKGKPHHHGHKISSARKGVKYTDQALENFSIGQRKRFADMSAEERRELTAAARNHAWTPEEKERRSNSLKAAAVKRKLNANNSIGKEVK